MSKKRGTLVTAACVEEMGRLVRLAASPAVPGEKVPHAIARAARRLGLPRGRVETFWYGKARRVDAGELETARKVASERTKDAELLRDEYRRAIEILGRLEARLTATDEDFYSADLDALRDLARGQARAGRVD